MTESVTTVQTVTILPAAAYLFWPGQFRWWLAVPYWLWLLAVNLGPFVLMLRMYWPGDAVINGTWKPPAVMPATSVTNQ